MLHCTGHKTTVPKRRPYVRSKEVLLLLTASLTLVLATPCGLHNDDAKAFSKHIHADDWLCEAAGDGNVALVRELLAAKFNIEHRTSIKGWRPLMRAAMNGRLTAASLLLDAGASVDARDDDGWTALMMAAAEGHEALVAILLDASADAHAKDKEGRSALDHARQWGHTRIVRVLQKLYS